MNFIWPLFPPTENRELIRFQQPSSLLESSSSCLLSASTFPQTSFNLYFLPLSVLLIRLSPSPVCPCQRICESRCISWCIGCKYVSSRKARVGLPSLFFRSSWSVFHPRAPSDVRHTFQALRSSLSLFVISWKIVNYLILNVQESPGSNEINDVLSLLLHVSHRVSVKERLTWPGLALCISNRTWCLFGCYNTLLLCWCCLVSFWFFSQSQEVGSCIAER